MRKVFSIDPKPGEILLKKQTYGITVNNVLNDIEKVIRESNDEWKEPLLFDIWNLRNMLKAKEGVKLDDAMYTLR